MQSRVLVVVFLLAAFSGCEQQQTGKRILARVGDAVLTEEEARSSMDTSVVPYKDQIRNFVNSWVTTEILFQEAQKQGIDQQAETQRQLDELKKQIVVQQFLQSAVYAESSAVHPDTLSVYFEQHQDEYFVREDMMKLNIIGFVNREQASAFASRIARGTGWDNAYAEAVKAPESANDIVFVSSGTYYSQQTLLFPELWKVAQTLGENDISFPVHAQTGYFIVQMLSSVRKGTPASREVAGDEVRLRFLRERRQQRFDSLVGTLRRHSAVEILLPPARQTDTIQQTVHD